MTILNIISIISTFTVTQLLFCLFFNITFQKVKILNKQILLSVQIKHVLSFLISTLLLIKYTIFYIPFK